MKNISWLVLLSTLLLCGNSAMAEMQNWKVAKVQGEAILSKPGFAPRRVELHDSFGAGQKITTSADASVSLVRNTEAFIISPNSEIEIPSDENTSTFTLFFQTLGTVLFSAKKKNRHHFKVQTPFAAALVKGTTFAINVTSNNYQIQVFEGSVELKGHNRKDSHIVNAGAQSQVKYQIRNKIQIKKVLNDLGNNPHLGNDIEKLAKTYREKIVIGSRGKINLQKAANDQTPKANNDVRGKAQLQATGKLRAKTRLKANNNLKVSGNFDLNGKGNINRSEESKEHRGSNGGGDKSGNSGNSGSNSGNGNSGNSGNNSGSSGNSGSNGSNSGGDKSSKSANRGNSGNNKQKKK